MKRCIMLSTVFAFLYSPFSIQVYSQQAPPKVSHQGIYLNPSYSKLYNPFITVSGDFAQSRMQIEESYSFLRFGSGIEIYQDRWGFSMGVGFGYSHLEDMAIDRTVGSMPYTDNYSDISFSILSLDVGFCYILSQSVPLGISITAFVSGMYDSYNRFSNYFSYKTDNEKISNSYGSGGFGIGMKYFILNNLSLNVDYMWVSGEATQKLAFQHVSGEWGYYYFVGTGKYSWSNLLSVGISYTIPLNIIPKQ